MIDLKFVIGLERDLFKRKLNLKTLKYDAIFSSYGSLIRKALILRV